MTVEELLSRYGATNTITDDIIIATQDEDNLDMGREMIYYFRKHKNRGFILALLHKMIELRSKPWGTALLPVSGDAIMLASYLLGLHGQIEDSLEIWNAKNTDFDTYCYVDIQLVVFAGVNETLAYLEKEGSENALRAHEYVSGCLEHDGFNNIEDYFNSEKLPWFVWP
jgi:hypothetical protein